MKKLLFLFILFSSFIDANEKYINQSWCSANGGVSEYRTKYGTYVDCLTEEYAVEVEFDYNWKESIGQSLHYAEATNKRPAVLIIKRTKSKKDYLVEFNQTIYKFNLPITIFVINE
ncbi:MAG: hypothetical protein O3A49_05150 [Candidatus Marinimicrobia bacterium]|nr:hypothetical protein [Candidatus Neomarinimicrobiota bacterium]